MSELKISYSDLCIYLADCLRDVDGININWRVLMAYLHGFEEDKKVEVKVIDKAKFYENIERFKKNDYKINKSVRTVLPISLDEVEQDE